MLNAIKRIPAGTFLVPMLVSAFIYTFWPNLFQIGGLTQHIFGGDGTNGIIGAICFCSGTGIDLKKIGYALKRQGVLLLAKFIIGAGISLLYISTFGQAGVLGISALAFTITICSINPAVYLSLMQQYGTEQDTAVYGVTGLFSIAAVCTDDHVWNRQWRRNGLDTSHQHADPNGCWSDFRKFGREL